MKFIYCFIFLLTYLGSNAQAGDTVLTDSQINDLIIQITEKPDVIRRTFSEKNELIKEEYIQIYPLTYEKYFYPNGKIKKEGLYYYGYWNINRIGAWKYYKENGDLFKEFNYSDYTRKLTGSNEEAHDKYFTEAKNKAETYLVSKLGKDFFENHFQFDKRNSWWFSDAAGISESWSETPESTKDLGFYLYYSMLVDSHEVHKFSLRIDPDKITESEYDSIPDCFHYPERCEIKMSMDEAKKIAEQNNFKSTSCGLKFGKDTWNWVFSITDYKDPCHREVRGRTLEINTQTKEVNETGWNNRQSHGSCPYPFTQPTKNAVPLKQGEKKLDFNSHFEINVPSDWRKIEEIHDKGEEKNYFTNEKSDTLFFRYDFTNGPIKGLPMHTGHIRIIEDEIQVPIENIPVCADYHHPGPAEYKLMRECDSLQKAIQLRNENRIKAKKHYEDSVAQVIREIQLKKEKREQNRKDILTYLENSFSSSMNEKRNIKCTVEVNDEDQYKIEVHFSESMYNSPDYSVSTKELNLHETKRMAEIIKTIRFKFE